MYVSIAEVFVQNKPAGWLHCLLDLFFAIFIRKRHMRSTRGALIVFVAGLFLGLFIGIYQASDMDRIAQGYAVRQRGTKFTNPLLECEVAKDALGDKELRPFQRQVQDFIGKEMRARRIEDIGVYFRDLNNGPSFGINNDKKFSPASLFKVPLMIAYFKLAESDPKILGKKLTYTGRSDDNALEYYRPSQAIQPGKAYTIDELIYRMIVYSDNNAKDILLSEVDTHLLAQVHLDLGVEIPSGGTPEDFISAQAYSSFFRVLFNASYLSREMSEKALRYLSEADFKLGLVAGAPPGIPVAHKFGEHRLKTNAAIKELHDCGIVYYPANPYLLCVMAKGRSFEDIGNVIRDISRIVFNEINVQHKGPAPVVAVK